MICKSLLPVFIYASCQFGRERVCGACLKAALEMLAKKQLLYT